MSCDSDVLSAGAGACQQVYNKLERRNSREHESGFVCTVRTRRDGMHRADRDKSMDSCPGDKAVDSASTAGRGRRDIVCWLVEAIRVLNGG